MLNVQDCKKQKWSELRLEFKPKKCGSLLQHHTTDGSEKVHQIFYRHFYSNELTDVTKGLNIGSV